MTVGEVNSVLIDIKDSTTTTYACDIVNVIFVVLLNFTLVICSVEEAQLTVFVN